MTGLLQRAESTIYQSKSQVIGYVLTGQECCLHIISCRTIYAMWHALLWWLKKNWIVRPI